MNLTKLTAVALVSTIALTSFASVSKAAEEPDTARSTATVKVVTGSGTEVTPPIDPEPITPKPDITDNTGPLSIDVAPHFQFAEAKVVAGTAVYPLANTNNPYVQVTDTRGSGAGWDLQVKISQFMDDTKILKGAQMTLGFDSLKTTNLGGITDAAPTTVSSLALNNQAQTIFSAEEETGLGTWANYFNKATTNPTSKLEISGGNYVGEYAATIDWTLSDAPTP